MRKQTEKYVKYSWKAAICWSAVYVVSLLPIFLPWFYFDQEIDGIKYGVTFLNNRFSYLIFILTLVSMFTSKMLKKGEKITLSLLCLHVVVYIYWFCFWYNETVADFSLAISFETARFGFYISLFCSLALCISYYLISLRRKAGACPCRKKKFLNG